MITRRGFLVGSAASAAVTATAGCLNGKKGAVALDPNRVVVVADIHIPLPLKEQQYPDGGRDRPWIVGTVKANIAEILALDPLPANVIALGDMSMSFGEEREYAILRELLQPLYDRGIAVTLGMGNHDIRASYAKSFPEAAAKSLVPGRYVHRVETPHADFILLDSLVEPKIRGRHNELWGAALGKEQSAWFEKELKALKKPTFVCAHHGPYQLKVVGKITKCPKVVGYLYGHGHRWSFGAPFSDYGVNARTIRSVGIGSFGIDGDIGYAIMDLAPTKATLKVVNKYFYFPAPRPAEKRPPLWDELRRDHIGKQVVFPFEG